jgi:hypothetical protein
MLTRAKPSPSESERVLTCHESTSSFDLVIRLQRA